MMADFRVERFRGGVAPLLNVSSNKNYTGRECSKMVGVVYYWGSPHIMDLGSCSSRRIVHEVRQLCLELGCLCLRQLSLL